MAKAAQDAGLSTSGTVAEMQKLQQQGLLVSEKVLPFFAKRLHEAAINNGGLEKAMLSNRVAMNRLMVTLQQAADVIFKSGFAEGLTDFFNTSAEMIKENQSLWQALGKILGGVFSALTKAVQFLRPILWAFGYILESLTKILGDFSGVILLLNPKVFNLAKGLVAVTTAATGLKGIQLAMMAGRWLLVATAIREAVIWLQEFINLFTHEYNGILWNEKQGYVSKPVENMVKRAKSGEITGGTPMQIFANAGFGMAKDAFSEYIQPMFSNWFSSNSRDVVVNNTITLDGEKVGESVSRSQAVNNMVDTKVSNAVQ